MTKYSLFFCLVMFLAAWLPVFSHPQYLQCTQTLAVGQPLMLAPYVATLSTERTVVVTRGSTVVTDGTYIPGETLGIAISNTANAEYIFQASNAAFVNGQCSNTRSQVTAPAQLVMPSSGDVTVFFGWQTTGPADVLISPTVTLTAQATTDDTTDDATDDTPSDDATDDATTDDATMDDTTGDDTGMDDATTDDKTDDTMMDDTTDDTTMDDATDDVADDNMNDYWYYSSGTPSKMPTGGPHHCHDHRMPPPYAHPRHWEHSWCNNGDSFSHCGVSMKGGPAQWSCCGETCCPASHGCCDTNGNCMVCKPDHDQDDDQCHHGKPPRHPCDDHPHRQHHHQPHWGKPNSMPTWSVFSEAPRLRKRPESFIQRAENELHAVMEAFQQRL